MEINANVNTNWCFNGKASVKTNVKETPLVTVGAFSIVGDSTKCKNIKLLHSNIITC